MFRRIRNKLTLLKSKVSGYRKKDIWKVQKDNLWFIIGYSIIVSLAVIAVFDLYHGRIQYWDIPGYGCFYYLVVDFIKFMTEQIKDVKGKNP